MTDDDHTTADERRVPSADEPRSHGFVPTPPRLPAAAERGLDQGLRVLSYLIAGVLLYGGLGWLGDHLLHTRFLLPVGIVLGAGLATYMIIRRFGTVEPSAPTTGPRVPQRPSTRVARGVYPKAGDAPGHELDRELALTRTEGDR